MTEAQGKVIGLLWLFQNPVGTNLQCWKHLTQQYIFFMRIIYSIQFMLTTLLRFESVFFNLLYLNIVLHILVTVLSTLMKCDRYASMLARQYLCESPKCRLNIHSERFS